MYKFRRVYLHCRIACAGDSRDTSIFSVARIIVRACRAIVQISILARQRDMKERKDTTLRNVNEIRTYGAYYNS